jgi:predicted PhzF superfamily epimerase YddE/YHI9
MSLPVFGVDAFADAPFGGNPAAVVLLDGPMDDRRRAQIAAEFNLSETAFVEGAAPPYGLRWFTPAVEVALCGHATLAAAHALWESGRLPAGAVAEFDAKSGRLSARREGEWIALDLPSSPVAPAKPLPGMVAALGETPLALGENADLYLFELDGEDAVRRAKPDLAKWAALTRKGLVLTAPSRRKTHDCVSRCFFPGDGIAEDPVTGSAHCAIGPYWAGRLSKPVITAFQASARGGTLIVRPKDGRVEVAGRAVTVWRGELTA